MTLQLETIRREFPALDPGDANVIDACCLHDAAASNVRRILRSCPEEHLGQGGGIVADEILHHHPDVRDAMDDTPDAFDYWDYQCGFSEVRTRVLQAALSAMGGRMLETLIRELGEIEHWIACMAEMGIAPAVSDWADCLEQHERWRNVVLGRQCEYAAADFWAEHDDLHAWNTLSGAVAMDGLVIVPILSQSEFATECARRAPDLYQQYVNLCIENLARPFLAYSEASGETVTICVLSMERSAWVLSEPSYAVAEPEVIDALQKFASLYRCNVNGARPNAHRSWLDDPAEHTSVEMADGEMEPDWGDQRMAA